SGQPGNREAERQTGSPRRASMGQGRRGSDRGIWKRLDGRRLGSRNEVDPHRPLDESGVRHGSPWGRLGSQRDLGRQLHMGADYETTPLLPGRVGVWVLRGTSVVSVDPVSGRLGTPSPVSNRWPAAQGVGGIWFFNSSHGYILDRFIPTTEKVDFAFRWPRRL